jgi:hypothetical protein
VAIKVALEKIVGFDFNWNIIAYPRPPLLTKRGIVRVNRRFKPG